MIDPEWMLENLARALDFVEPVLVPLGRFLETHLSKLVSWSDPITVSITLFIIFSPFALAYTCLTRMAIVRMMQMDVKGKNILYVIAHPDDEAM